MDSSRGVSTNRSNQSHPQLPGTTKRLNQVQSKLDRTAMILSKFEKEPIDEEQFMRLACEWSRLDSQLSSTKPVDITAGKVRQTARQVEKFNKKVKILSSPPEKSSSNQSKALDTPKKPNLAPKLHLDAVKGGPTGLKNLGNSCYLNSSVQMLFNIPEVREIINKDGPKAKEEELLATLYALLNIKNENESEPLLKKLRTILLAKGLDNGENPTGQKDPHEVLNIILDELKWSPMVEGIRYQSKDTPDTTLSDKQSNYGLSIELDDSKEAASFQEVVNGYFKDEIMEPDAHVEMKGTEVYNLKKTHEIVQLPSHLVVSLNRFKNTKDSLGKINTPVRFPDNKIVTLPYGDKQVEYEIVGYVNHHGETMDSGHYTANVKNCKDPESKKRWVKCDDSNVKEIAPNIQSESAYLVLLKRKESKQG